MKKEKAINNIRAFITCYCSPFIHTAELSLPEPLVHYSYAGQKHLLMRFLPETCEVCVYENNKQIDSYFIGYETMNFVNRNILLKELDKWLETHKEVYEKFHFGDRLN